MDLPVGDPIVLELPVRDDEDQDVSSNESEYEYEYDLAMMFAESTEIRITEVGARVEGTVRSVAFIAFRDGTGRPSDDDVRTLVENDKLFSLGNDRVTLVPQALVPTSDMEGLHDGPLPTRGIEGSDDGPFPANTPKIIDFEPGSDVTIYRYSRENRAFERLGQPANSVISVTIDASDASTGLVVIKTLTETSTETYTLASSSIFEIVVSLASTRMIHLADGTTSIEEVTRTSNIRTFAFAVASTPLSKEEAGAFTDDARTVTTLTLVSDDEIEAGPYATYSGDGSSVFADADLFPALPDMVGGVFDYVVTGEPSLEGGRAAVMIEFADEQEVDGLAYYVYQRQSDEGWGWARFVVDDANRIYSAPKPCPALSASREAVVPEPGRVYAWELAHEGLGTDHRCVLVEFSDGGMNDADQTANAFAYSTGAFASSSRPFTLDFQSASGDFIDVLRLTSGQSTSVMLVFGMSPGDALNMDESVEVELALADITESRVTVSPMLVTFASNSTTSEVELSVSGDAPSGTFRLQIVGTTVTQGAEGERILPTSGRPILAVEVRPVVGFIPDLDEDGNIADGFVNAVDSLAPGAIATTVTGGGDRPYILVPGIGVETVIAAAALLGDNFSPSLGVCVAYVMRGGSAPTALPATCDFLSGSLAENPNIRVSPYINVLFWVGLSADGTVATNAGGTPIQVGEPQVVYVAPPVGFRTSFWVYDSTNPDAILPLGIGVRSTNIPPSIALVLDLPVADGETPVAPAFSTNESEYDASVLAGTLTESTEIRITEVEGVAFIAFLDGTGRPSDDGLVRTLVGNETLFSLGNDRVTLVPQASLPTSNMEGRDDGPFLANTPKTIVFAAGSDVTIYRYSSETRAFGPLGQASLWPA